MRLRTAAALAGLTLLAACTAAPSGETVDTAATAPADPAPGTIAASPTPEGTPTPTPATGPTALTPTPEPGAARPVWLGTRVLPERPDGFGEIQPTPPELVDRRLPPPGDHPLPPPETDVFAARIRPVPADVAARSTWHEGCPVGLDDLRYVTLHVWGFDERAHTGELLVHADAADDLVGVFEALYEARFPIEEMRVVRADELDAPPTGDGNVTTAFVCRPAVGQTRWSDHASGLAVDINPFHNPYARGDVVLPELASAYVDRDDHRPGMIQPGDVATSAFAEIGWGWGGSWRSAKDWMHFSASGR